MTTPVTPALPATIYTAVDPVAPAIDGTARAVVEAAARGMLDAGVFDGLLSRADRNAMLGVVIEMVERAHARSNSALPVDQWIERILKLPRGGGSLADRLRIADAAASLMRSVGGRITSALPMPPGTVVAALRRSIGAGSLAQVPPLLASPEQAAQEAEARLNEYVDMPTKPQLAALRTMRRPAKTNQRTRDVLTWRRWGEIACTPNWDTIQRRLARAEAVEGDAAPTIPGWRAIRSWSLLGVSLHTLVQDRYAAFNRNNVVVADRTVCYRNGRTNLSAFQKREKPKGFDPHTIERLRMLDADLTSDGETHLRCDLADLTANRIFEIKPRAGAREAVVQLWHYQAAFNLSQQMLLGTGVQLPPYQEGVANAPDCVVEGTDCLPLMAREIVLYIDKKGRPAIKAVVFEAAPDDEGVSLPGVVLYDVYRRKEDDEEEEEEEQEQQEQEQQEHEHQISGADGVVMALLAWLALRLGSRGTGAGDDDDSDDDSGTGGSGPRVFVSPVPVAPAANDDIELPAAARVALALIVITLVIALLPEEVVAAGFLAAAALVARIATLAVELLAPIESFFATAGAAVLRALAVAPE